MKYTGSCHCGDIAFEFEATFDAVLECNCSHCSRKGYLLTFIPHEQLQLNKGASSLSAYTFNKHVIQHHFCSTCGCAPFGFGDNPKTGAMAAINVRCLEDVDRSKLKVVQVDGKSA